MGTLALSSMGVINLIAGYILLMYPAQLRLTVFQQTGQRLVHSGHQLPVLLRQSFHV